MGSNPTEGVSRGAWLGSERLTMPRFFLTCIFKSGILLIVRKVFVLRGKASETTPFLFLKVFI